MTLIKMITVSSINIEQNVNRQLIMLQSQGCEIIDLLFELDKENTIVIIIYKKMDGEL